jgi:uncharacterized membrane protein YjgN (DUF898 family)
MLGVMVAALCVLPVAFVTIGFIAASALLFATGASALRAQRPTARTLMADGVAGVIVALVLFVVFTRGLGVQLPGPRF